MIGSTPALRSAIATASGEQWAWADGIVGGVEGVDVRLHRLELAQDLVLAAAVDHRHLGGDDELAGVRACAQAPTSSIGRPAGGDLLVAAADQVQPRRGSPQRVVDRRPEIVDVAAPQRQPLGALDRLEPDAPHLGLDLAVAVRAHAAAGTVAERLRARHRAGHAGRVQHALAAHLATPDRLLDRVLCDAWSRPDRRRQPDHAGTFSRRSSISSLAFLTADDASAE